MEIKKIINLFRKAEGYIGLNAAYANEIQFAPSAGTSLILRKKKRSKK